ncbi:MAG: hypothetical protein ACK5LO_07410 [Leucobacter sp.]
MHEIPFDASAEELARLAADQPELWPQILRHPNVYPELVGWIAEQQRLDALEAGAGVPGTPGGGAVQDFESPEASGVSEVPGVSGISRRGARRRGSVVLAIAAVAVLVLGGATAALAATGVLASWFGGGSPSAATDKAATGTAAVEQGPSRFAGGLARAWEVRGETVAVSFDEPMPIAGGVVFQNRPGGDAGVVRVVSAESGETVWEEAATGTSCVAVPVETDAAATGGAVCSLARGLGSGPTDVVTVSSEGERSRFTLEGSFSVVGLVEDDMLLSDTGRVLRVDREGRETWTVSLPSTAVTGYRDFLWVGERLLGRSLAGWVVLSVDGEVLGHSEGDDRDYLREGAIDCTPMLTGERLLLSGAECDASAQVEGLPVEMLSKKNDGLRDAALVRGEHAAWLYTYDGETTAYDLETGEARWTAPGELLEWPGGSQLVRREGAAGGAVLQRWTDGGGASLSVVDIATGDVVVADGEYDGSFTTAVDDVVVTYEAGSSGARVQRVLDGRTLEVLSESTVDLGAAVAALGGPDGAIMSLASESSEHLDGFAFYGPGEAGGAGSGVGGSAGGAGDEGGISDGLAKPVGMPDCPADTVLVAWAEFEGGWVLFCGVTADRPSYAVLQRPGGSEPLLSKGASKPGSDRASGAVTWDAQQQRFSARMSDGSFFALESDTGTATLWPKSEGSGEPSFEKWVSIVYVDMADDAPRVLSGSGSGAASSQLEFPACDAMNPAAQRAVGVSGRGIGSGDAEIFGPVVRTALQSAERQSACEWRSGGTRVMQWVSEVSPRSKNALIDGMLDFGYRAEADGALLRVSYTQETENGPERHTHVFDGNAWIFIFQSGSDTELEAPALEAVAAADPGRFAR